MGNLNRLPWILVLLLVLAVLGVLLVESQDDEHAVSAMGEGSGDAPPEAALLQGITSPSQDATRGKAAASELRTATQSGAVAEGHSPPRTLEVRLFVGDKPLRGAVVLLWRHLSMPMRTAIARPPDYEQQSDESGFVRFVDLPHDVWTPGVRIDGGTRNFGPQVVLDHSPNRICVFRLGAGSITGTVYADTGEPAEGATLSMSHGLHGGTQVRTDGMGRYRLPHVARQHASIRMRLPLLHAESNAERSISRLVETRPPRQFELDWGSPAGRPLLQGQVVCEDGKPVRGPGLILLKSEHSGVQTNLGYGVDGSFRRRVDPLAYQVTVIPRASPQRIAFDLDLSSDLTDVRWTLPGTRVLMRVEFADGTPLPPTCRLSIAPLTNRRRMHGAAMHDGVFRFDGVPQGEYRVRLRIGKERGRIVSTVVVEDGVAEVAHNVVVPRK